MTCPACGSENHEGAKFCSECGAALTGATAPAREERKVVTVLFCDLVGSTARAEGADPEDVRALLSAYHERVRSELERFGGTVEKFIGDAVMALFGAPIAHEDDPERAVRAALAIRDWAQDESDLQVRIGITTGEALVTLDTRPEAGEGMASGDVVNTAARLQAGAPVSGVLVDETTQRATRDVIEYAEHPPVEAKGKADPVPVWEVSAAQSRLSVDVRQHGAAQLVGRERELELLVATLDRVRAERSPQLVTLVGAPGIGKSRLVFELMQHVEQEPDLVTWRQGRSLPYGEGVTFWALGEMVKAQAGILENDTAGELDAKLRRSVQTLIAADGDSQWVQRHLRPLVGLAADSDAALTDQDEAFAAWRRFFEALAEWRPLVLVFDDLHWADEGLLDFVDYLPDWATGAPIAVLCTARPELLDRRPGWGGGKLNASTQAISPLDEHETARLISGVLATSVLPAETQTTLLERAGGNPLYAEQFARLYVERGTAEDLLPETVQGIVGARLDTLPAEEKEVLHDASVMGKVFWSSALSGEPAALRRVLHALERKAFVRRERNSSVEGHDEYAFAHMLVREVAYGQIPRAVRAEKHLRAATWIESLGRLDDRAEMLAHHYAKALEYARAAGQEDGALAKRARLVFRDAGDHARSLNAFASAARFYAEAVELWPEGEPERASVLLACGQALRRAETGGADVLVAARDAFAAAGDAEGAAEAEAALGELFWERNDPQTASEHLERAAALVVESEPSPAKAYVLASCSRLWTFVGREREALDAGREAVAMAESLGLDDLRAHALDNVGLARVRLGDVGGLADLEHSVAIARRANSARETLRALWNLAALVGGTMGELDRGEELAREGLALAARLGSEYWQGTFTYYLSQNAYFAGRWDEALTLDEGSSTTHGPAWSWHVTLVHVARGRLADAVSSAAVQLEQDRRERPDDVDTVASSLALYARTLIAAGERADATLFADELVQLLSGGGHALGTVGEGWLLIAFALEELGREADLLASVDLTAPGPFPEFAMRCAEGDLVAAADICARVGTRPEEAFARLRAAERLVAQGRRAEADEQLQEALSFWRSVGGTYYVRRGEALVAQSA